MERLACCEIKPYILPSIFDNLTKQGVNNSILILKEEIEKITPIKDTLFGLEESEKHYIDNLLLYLEITKDRFLSRTIFPEGLVLLTKDLFWCRTGDFPRFIIMPIKANKFLIDFIFRKIIFRKTRLIRNIYWVSLSGSYHFVPDYVELYYERQLDRLESIVMNADRNIAFSIEFEGIIPDEKREKIVQLEKTAKNLDLYFLIPIEIKYWEAVILHKSARVYPPYIFLLTINLNEVFLIDIIPILQENEYTKEKGERLKFLKNK